jgi:hypothetical protein
LKKTHTDVDLATSAETALLRNIREFDDDNPSRKPRARSTGRGRRAAPSSPAPCAFAFTRSAATLAIFNFLRMLATPESIKDRTLTTLREKLITIGVKVVYHARRVAFQMAEVWIPRNLFADILRMF